MFRQRGNRWSDLFSAGITKKIKMFRNKEPRRYATELIGDLEGCRSDFFSADVKGGAVFTISDDVVFWNVERIAANWVLMSPTIFLCQINGNVTFRGFHIRMSLRNFCSVIGMYCNRYNGRKRHNYIQ
jgi:hypothetical protein